MGKAGSVDSAWRFDEPCRDVHQPAVSLDLQYHSDHSDE